MKKELRLKELVTPADCFSLEGKRTIVIGGAGKMAASFSRTLLAAQCISLILVDQNRSALRKVTERLSEEFPGRDISARFCRADDDTALRRLARSVENTAGRIDVLIYSVMSKPKDYYAPLPDYPRRTWDEALSGNLSGAFVATQVLLPLMKTSGSIIYVSSIYGIVSPDLRIYGKSGANIYGGKYPLTLPAVYSASKAGLIGLTRYMAVYMADKDIRVNALVPGGVYDHQDESFYREYARKTPLRRMAAWTDYNGPVLFLASDASRYMTGQLLIVDGGFSAW